MECNGDNRCTKKVHRARFMSFIPQGIQCIAIKDGEKPLKLALARSDGSIEIWRYMQRWCQEGVIPGLTGTSYRSLIWINDRLFSAGLHGSITEWDIKRLSMKASIESGAGSIWCMSLSHNRKTLAIGCQDGSVRLFTIDPELALHKVFIRLDCQIISIAWHHDDDMIVTGTDKSMILLWDVNTGSSNTRITLDEFQQKTTVVWAITIMKDKTIISADSLGKVQFWNGNFGTLISVNKPLDNKSLRNQLAYHDKAFQCHQADALTLYLNKSENILYSSGIDHKIVQYQSFSSKDSDSVKWVKSGFSTRGHTHDVNCLVTAEVKDHYEMVISGGIDGNLVINKINGFGLKPPLKVVPFPQYPVLSHTAKDNIILYQKQHSLQIWSLGSANENEVQDTVANTVTKLHLKDLPVMLLEIKSKSNNNIVCSAISPSGVWAVYSDCKRTKLYKLDLDRNNSNVIKSVALGNSVRNAHRMCFTVDESKLILATADGIIQILQVSQEDISVFYEYNIANALKDFGPGISLSCSHDSNLVAYSDQRGHIFVLDISERKKYCEMPKFDAQPMCMSFQPNSHVLAIVTIDNQIQLYDCDENELTQWSKEYIMHGMPKDWSRSEAMVHLSFDPSNCSRIMLHDSKALYFIDLSKPIPSVDAKLSSKKRKRKWTKMVSEVPAVTDNFVIYDRYKYVLHADYLSDGSIYVVEIPPLSMLESLPPILERKTFGT